MVKNFVINKIILIFVKTVNMKKYFLLIVVLFGVYGFSQQPKPKTVQKKDTLVYWNGKLLTKEKEE